MNRTESAPADLLSIAVYAIAQLKDASTLTDDYMNLHFAIAGGGWMVEITILGSNPTKGQTVNRTAQIMAEMRAENDAANAKGGKGLPKIRPALSTAKGRNEALATAAVLLKGTETWDMNNAKRDHSLPRRAISMASSRGRATPDMQASLMEFFSSPGSMAEHLLASFLPARPNYNTLVAYLDGLGIVATKAEITALKLFGGSRTGGAGGRPRKVRLVQAFGQGHSRAYVSTAVPTGRIPGGNDVMHGVNAARRQGR